MAKYSQLSQADSNLTARPRLSHADSFELQSLASSDHNSQPLTPPSRDSRDFSGSDLDEFNNDDYQHLLNQTEADTRHARDASNGSTIDDLVFVLPETRLAETEVPLEKQKRLSLFDGLSLCIGLQIGSGIFSSPTQVDINAGSVGASLVVWIVAGLLAWTGASSFAELGATIPLNGSSQAYLRHIYGPIPSFLFAWAAVVILKPGSAAIIAIIFGEYIAKTLPESFSESWWLRKLFAFLALAAVTTVNCVSTKLGARTGNVFFILKIVLLISLIALGIVGAVVLRGNTHVHTSALVATGGKIFEGSSHDIGRYAIALYAGLWAYDGWDNVTYVSAEMKNPRKDLPRVVHIALPTVIAAYLLANLSYYAVLSKEELSLSSTVTLAMAKKVIGGWGALVFAILIALSCLGALNATIFTYARLIYTSSKDGFFPSIFSHTHLKRGTPLNSLVLSAALTTIFILVGEFHSLLTFYGLAAYLFYFWTVLGVIVLRVREPALDRPYKTFITTPILFCCVALFLVSRTVFERPLESLYAILFILVGIPIYYWRVVNWESVFQAVPTKLKSLFRR